jgi:hypothetical protein
MENIRCVMGYIVDLTVIMDDMLTARVLSPKNVRQALERQVRSGRRDAIHRDIRSFVAEAFPIRFSITGKDPLLERIIDLIKQFCVPH